MIGTLRGRLLALFFLVSLIPSLGLTFFVTQYLARSLAALKNPETERALTQSLEVIRGGIERLASDARQHAEAPIGAATWSASSVTKREAVASTMSVSTGFVAASSAYSARGSAPASPFPNRTGSRSSTRSSTGGSSRETTRPGR